MKTIAVAGDEQSQPVRQSNPKMKIGSVILKSIKKAIYVREVEGGIVVRVIATRNCCAIVRDESEGKVGQT